MYIIKFKMGTITGYLTYPNLSKNSFISKCIKLKNLGLEIRLFQKGLRRGKEIGPNGILLSGNSNLNSKDIIKIFYEKLPSKSYKGLTYDISSSSKGEDFEVRKLNFSNFNTYFCIRVKIVDENNILKFTKDYLKEYDNLGFRYAEPNYVVYECLTYKKDLDSNFKNLKKDLLKKNFKLNEKENTFIYGLYKLD